MAHWFGSQGHKTRIFVKNVYVRCPVDLCTFFPHVYICEPVPKALTEHRVT